LIRGVFHARGKKRSDSIVFDCQIKFMPSQINMSARAMNNKVIDGKGGRLNE
jgi:hypothetical protein